MVSKALRSIARFACCKTDEKSSDHCNTDERSPDFCKTDDKSSDRGRQPFPIQRFSSHHRRMLSSTTTTTTTKNQNAARQSNSTPPSYQAALKQARLKAARLDNPYRRGIEDHITDNTLLGEITRRKAESKRFLELANQRAYVGSTRFHTTVSIPEKATIKRN